MSVVKYRFVVTVGDGKAFEVWSRASTAVINRLYAGPEERRLGLLSDSGEIIRKWFENGRGALVTGYRTRELKPEDIHTFFATYTAVQTIEIEIVEDEIPTLVQASSVTQSDLNLPKNDFPYPG